MESRLKKKKDMNVKGKLLGVQGPGRDQQKGGGDITWYWVG
jgi:hypothetical protein